ncbi:MAG: capsule assembly Wzi family protein, partial [Dehalococcoidia bacterium]|nr:capsule assembly Wzi family protein [Dehalococcoidia bacterium]
MLQRAGGVTEAGYVRGAQFFRAQGNLGRVGNPFTITAVLPRPTNPLARVAALVLTLVVVPAALAAQGVPRVGGRSEIFAGGELENYLRLLQMTGAVPLYPWSVRAFSPGEVDRLVPRDSAHPWVGRYDLAPRTSPGLSVDLVRPRVALIENTAFPFGANDGPVWAGRGLTTVVQAGVAIRYGPLSATFAPIVFRAENAAFDLIPNGQSGNLVYADGMRPGTIDLPQRFGDAPYTAANLGQSTLRLDVGALAVGVSTANQVWGPADRSPLILGNNAAGFPHVFVGTAHPMDLWIARIHGRIVYGDLRQSAYSSVSGPGSRRFGAGYVAVVEPRGARGLELGLTRFFHRSWPEGGPGWKEFLWPLQSILKADPNDPRFENPDNQLISVFARWVLPKSGLELYGEFARDDNARDLRDLLLEFDHDVGYTLRLRKIVRSSPARLVVVRAEVMNTRVTNLQRGGRGEAPFYVHTEAGQGHTQYGQILGAPDGYGGASSFL